MHTINVQLLFWGCYHTFNHNITDWPKYRYGKNNKQPNTIITLQQIINIKLIQSYSVKYGTVQSIFNQF